MKDAGTQPLIPDVLPSDRETAYHHWAYVSDRNAAETARALGLSVRTVQDWVSRDGWKVRYDQERGDLAQRVRDTVELALIRAYPQLVEGYLKIFLGQGDHRQTLDKDGKLVTVYDHVPYQARVNAGKELRAMFEGPPTQYHHHTASMGNGSNGSRNGPPAPPLPRTFDPAAPLTREAAAAMTPEERAAWERSRRQT